MLFTAELCTFSWSCFLYNLILFYRVRNCLFFSPTCFSTYLIPNSIPNSPSKCVTLLLICLRMGWGSYWYPLLEGDCCWSLLTCPAYPLCLVADIWDLLTVFGIPFNALMGDSWFPTFPVFLFLDLFSCWNRAPSLVASQERMYMKKTETLHIWKIWHFSNI